MWAGIYSAKDQAAITVEDGSNFRGCDLTAECRLARANVRAQLPAAAPLFKSENRTPPGYLLTTVEFRMLNWTWDFLTGCASARGRVSKTQLTRGSTKAARQLQVRSSKTEGRRNPDHRRPKRSGPAVSDLWFLISFGLRFSAFGLLRGVVADK